MDFKPCLLIPVYNHGSLIGDTLERLHGLNLPCLIVDDGSEPATARLLRARAEDEPWLTVFRLEPNQGKGVAVLRGITEARRLGFSHAVQLDADGQHTLEDIPALLVKARATPDALVSAAPVFDDSIPRARLYGRYITHFWVWVETLSFSVIDSMCGFRVYPLAAVVAIREQEPCGDRMDFDPEVMVRWHWRGGHVIGLSTRVSYPLDGVSHFDVIKDNLRITRMHARLFFGMLLRLPVILGRRIRG